MSKHWKEVANPDKHIDLMSTTHIGGTPIEARKLGEDQWVYFVKVCGFTFSFINLAQIDEVIAYFSQKTYPSTREHNNGLEHYWQKWYERLPAGLTKANKKVKILKALEKAKKGFDSSH